MSLDFLTNVGCLRFLGIQFPIIVGCTIMKRILRTSCELSFLKSFPTKGISPSKGTLLLNMMLLVTGIDPINRAAPSGTSTFVVSVRFLDRGNGI